MTHLPTGMRAVEVQIEIGALEHLDEQTMDTAWMSLTERTALDSSVLRYYHVDLAIRCRSCGMEYQPPEPACLICPKCNAATPEVLRGKGILLRSIEAEEIEQLDESRTSS